MRGKSEVKDLNWIGGDSPGESFEEVLGAVYLDDHKKGGNGLDACSAALNEVAPPP